MVDVMSQWYQLVCESSQVFLLILLQSRETKSVDRKSEYEATPNLLAIHLQRVAITSNRELCHMTKLGLLLIFLPMPLVRVVELTCDTTPDIRAIEQADVIVTTPEKWDGISRSWQNTWDQLNDGEVALRK